MQVKQIMTRQVERIHCDANLQEAAVQMKSSDIGLLPVYDNDRLVGTLSDRDLVLNGLAENLDPEKTKISDVMSPGVTYCFEDQDIEEAADLMSEKQIRRLVVLDRDKRLVGIVSLGDLATTSASKEPAKAALSEISKPA